MLTLSNVLVSNYSNDYGVITQEQIDEQLYEQWCSLIDKLFHQARNIYNDNTWQRTSELNDLPQTGELFDVVADIFDLIGLINDYPLRRSSDIAICLVSYVSAPKKLEEMEKYGIKSNRSLFRLRLERYIARLIMVQSIKPVRLLEDENEDLRCIRRLKTKRNKKAKEAALLITQDDTTDNEAMSSKSENDSACEESTAEAIVESQSCEEQNQLPIHNLTRKDLLWVIMGEDICKDEKHHIMDIRANFEFYNGTNQLVTIRRCAHCKQYQISFEQFEHIWKEYGLPKVEPIYIGADGNIDGSYWKDRSVFSEHGYSVSQEKGLTTVQRQQKLKWIIDHGIMSKYDTIRFLRSRISINGMKPENWLARSKWAEDLRYVQSL